MLLKHSVICIFNENKEDYNMKTSENDVKYSSFNMGEMYKYRELYSREGDNSSRFEGKTVPWEHTIHVCCDEQNLFIEQVRETAGCVYDRQISR